MQKYETREQAAKAQMKKPESFVGEFGFLSAHAGEEKPVAGNQDNPFVISKKPKEPEDSKA